MSNQQLGKCRMLPYEVWPNLLLQSLVHIDSVYNNPKGIVNLLCWCLVSFFWKEPGLALPRFKQWPISAAINEAPCPLVIFNTTSQWHELQDLGSHNHIWAMLLLFCKGNFTVLPFEVRFSLCENICLFLLSSRWNDIQIYNTALH